MFLELGGALAKVAWKTFISSDGERSGDRVSINNSESDLSNKRKELNEHVVTTIIHGFTITHMITAAMLGPAAGGALTPMTTAMIFAIGMQCSTNFTVAKALKLVAHFAGLIAGTAIAEFILGLISGAGNLANACATGIVTEVLGWSAFIMLRDNLDRYETLSLSEKWNLLKAAIRLRNRNSAFMDKLKAARKRMSYYEQKKYDSCMEILTDRESTRPQRRDAMIQIQELLKPYGISF